MSILSFRNLKRAAGYGLPNLEYASLPWPTLLHPTMFGGE